MGGKVVLHDQLRCWVWGFIVVVITIMLEVYTHTCQTRACAVMDVQLVGPSVCLSCLVDNHNHSNPRAGCRARAFALSCAAPCQQVAVVQDLEGAPSSSMAPRVNYLLSTPQAMACRLCRVPQVGIVECSTRRTVWKCRALSSFYHTDFM